MARSPGEHTFELFLMLLMGGTLCIVALLISRLEMSVGLLLGVGIAVTVLVFFKAKIAIYLLICSMLLSPEFGVGGFATTGGTLGRGVTFRFDDFLLVIIAVSWLVKSALHKELGIFKRTPLNGAMLLYAFACFVSTLIGLAAGRVQLMAGSLFVLKYIQYFVLFFLVINNIEDYKQLRRYWVAVVVTAVIVGTIGLAQIPGGGRITAPFEGDSPEPNSFGGYLALLILICVALSLNLPELRSRLSYFAIACYLFVPFLFTLSRASYLGFIPGLAVVLLMSRQRLVSYSLLGLTFCLLLFPNVFPQVIRDRVTYTWTQAPMAGQVLVFGQRLDTSTSARLQSFQAALEDFYEEPLLGYGVTGWRFIDAQYFRTLLESGLLGLFALLFLCFRLFQLGLDRVRYFADEPFSRGLAVGFLGGLVCLLFHALGSNTFIIVRIMQPFWLVTGLVFSLRFVAAEELSEEEPEPLPQAV
ncbi:MAG: O-antigen ligase family protein [Acidobacteria bacterium]|nr:O-antigen ligase family protein [Acidobacteriota bacterium]